MNQDYLHTTLGRTGRPVFRLGLSASYRPGRETVFRAVEEGVNYFFAYGFDSQMVKALREVMKTKREKVVLATGAYNYIFSYSSPRKSLEKRLRQFGTEYLDVLMFLGVMKPKEFPARVLDEMVKLREEGKTRWIGISTHDRKFAGRMAREGILDVLMIRYNAAHRGAETDIFPHLKAHNPGIVSYTSTRWTRLLRRPKGWRPDQPVPTAGLVAYQQGAYPVRGKRRKDFLNRVPDRGTLPRQGRRLRTSRTDAKPIWFIRAKATRSTGSSGLAEGPLLSSDSNRLMAASHKKIPFISIDRHGASLSPDSFRTATSVARKNHDRQFHHPYR